MFDIQAIISKYSNMRTDGLDQRAALSQLKGQFDALNVTDQQEILRNLLIWETMNANPILQRGAADQKPSASMLSFEREYGGSKTKETMPLALCPFCSAQSTGSEVFCRFCGHVLESVQSQFGTRPFSDSNDQFDNCEYFGPDSVLALEVKENHEVFKLHPVDLVREIIIGRAEGGPLLLDVDLTRCQAEALGVSRLHMGLVYRERHHTISAIDLGSANGTFVNGRRLHPHEVRVLRRGDSLRLGKLVMTVYFIAPGN
jgi:hypothetical protein